MSTPLAPRRMKTFTFPLPDTSNVHILKPSIYLKVKKTKIKISRNKLNQESHLTHLSNLTQVKPKQNKKKNKKKKGLTFHFVGIPSNKANKSHKTTLKFDDIDMDPIVTIKSALKTSDTIIKLKLFIYTTFNIPIIHNLLIFYSHLMISNDNESKLKDFGITNQSLLIIAVSPRINLFDSNRHKHKRIINQQKTPQSGRDNLDIKCIKGFDIITQESDVNVFRMPSCAHVMSKQSLYQYAFTHFQHKNNLLLQCPHPSESKQDEKYEDNDWKCSKCTYINDEVDNKCVVCGTYKQWQCSRCTYINDGQYNKCQICEHYKSNDDEFVHNEKKMFCNEVWDYSLIKHILIAKEANSPNTNNVTDERQKLINKYYTLRHKYSKLKKENKSITFEFQLQLRKIQKQLIKQFNIADRTHLFKIRKKAKKDAMQNKFMYPKTKNYNSVKRYASTAKLELFSARNNIQHKYNLQKCPKCFCLYYEEKQQKESDKPKSMKETKKYETECVLCENVTSFCFCCGKPWRNGHLCDSTFRLQLIEILHNAKTKKVGDVKKVPSIRCCPKCCQLITHTEACKHMECTSCKTKFCFVCLKLYKNGWQCGSSGSKCPVAPRQDMKTLPNTVAILEKAFQLF